MRFIRKQGFHGVYLVTTEVDNPVKVVITNDPVTRLSELQVANFNRLHVHRFWWLPGSRISSRIERVMDDRQRRRFMLPAEAPSPLSGLISPSEQGYGMAMSSFQKTELRDAESLHDPRAIAGPPWRRNACGGHCPVPGYGALTAK